MDGHAIVLGRALFKFTALEGWDSGVGGSGWIGDGNAVKSDGLVSTGQIGFGLSEIKSLPKFAVNHNSIHSTKLV